MNVVCYAVYLLGWVLSIWQESYYIRRSIHVTLVFGNYRQIALLFRMIMVVVPGVPVNKLCRFWYVWGHITETSNH